ncbi:hypothetical protein ACN47E_001549 [Coniothyrium glycines]
MGGQLGFLYNQIAFKPKALPTSVRLDNQVALVTGANVGIGLETARQLSLHGVSRVILGVRDVSKGNTAKDSLVQSSPQCDFQVWQLDLESYDSILAFAERANTLDRLDIAVLNAGVKQLKWTTTSHEFETNLQVNHLGTALLSIVLLSILKATARQTGMPSRLTFTSSEVHFWTPFRERQAPHILQHMNEKNSFVEGLERYYTSKLLNLLWFRELANKVDAKEVIINGPNPGFINSQFHRHDTSGFFKVLTKLLAWTPEQGAYFLTDALVTKKAESHGAYIQEQKITPPSKFVLSADGKEAQRKVWDETLLILKRECPNVSFAV